VVWSSDRKFGMSFHSGLADTRVGSQVKEDLRVERLKWSFLFIIQLKQVKSDFNSVKFLASLKRKLPEIDGYRYFEGQVYQISFRDFF
jgi:hypothetical protein